MRSSPAKSLFFDIRMYLKHVDGILVDYGGFESSRWESLKKAEHAVREFERELTSGVLDRDEVYSRRILVFTDLAEVLNDYGSFYGK